MYDEDEIVPPREGTVGGFNRHRFIFETVKVGNCMLLCGLFNY
jgi:hypothetical protein